MLVISAVITLMITGIAGYLGKLKVKNSKDFISGGNKLGVVGVTSMLMGSIIGGASTVGTAQMAYSRGISAMWFILGISVASILLGLIYSKQIDKKNNETIPQIIGKTYGETAIFTSSMLLSIGMFVHINGQVIACMALLTAIFGVDIRTTAFIVVSLLVVYVIFGGFWGSTFVGGIKTILLYGTSIICGAILVFKFNCINEINTFFPKEPWFNPFSNGVYEDLASGLSTVVGVLSTQTYYQAVMAGRNSKTSKISAFVVALLVFPVGVVCTMIGMYMRIHYPNIAPAEAFPMFLIKSLNPILAGVSIATVLISSLATGAGLTLGISTMFVRDVYKRTINAKANDKKQLLMMRITILFIGIAVLIIVVSNSGSMILQWGFLSMVFRAAPIFVPIIGAMFFKDKINIKMGNAAIIAGPTASIVWIALGLPNISSIYIGLIVSAFILFGVKRLKSF